MHAHCTGNENRTDPETGGDDENGSLTPVSYTSDSSSSDGEQVSNEKK